MTIEKYLDLSTAHLPESERARLDAICEGTSDEPDDAWTPILTLAERGWWCHVPPDCSGQSIAHIRATFPALGNVISYARANECSQIRFDGDAPEHFGLPTYVDDEPEGSAVGRFRIELADVATRLWRMRADYQEGSAASPDKPSSTMSAALLGAFAHYLDAVRMSVSGEVTYRQIALDTLNRMLDDALNGTAPDHPRHETARCPKCGCGVRL